MLAKLKLESAIVVLACFAGGTMIESASAATAEIAKKCNALTAKAYPPRATGNPAAGSKEGSGPSQRAYFSKCVANGGKMDDNERK